MRMTQVLLPLAAALLIAGCGNRGTAQNAVGQAEAAVNGVKDSATSTAPEQLKATQATLAHMRENFDKREYKTVVADVPQFNEQMKVLKDAVAAGQTQAATASTEWTTLNTEVPKSVAAIQERVDSLKSGTLPKGMTKESLETAKTDFEAAKASWAEATAAANSGDTAGATEKGRMVQAKVEALKTQLAMNPALAKAG